MKTQNLNLKSQKHNSKVKDFMRFYCMALESANDTKYWLGLLKDVLGTDKNKINKLPSEVEELSNILAASLITMKNKSKIKI